MPRLFSHLSRATTAAGTAVANVGSDTLSTVQNRLSDCTIKGNVSFKNGERIYHVPGQLDYSSTVISSSKGERWFCTEDEARAAGWRRAGR